MNDSAVKPEARDILVIKRQFSASLERVFDAWTQKSFLKEWFGPVGCLVSGTKINLVVGGKYEIEICSPEGNRIRHFGTYVEISKPTKLVFTWMLEDQSCMGSEGLCAETLVSIDLKRVETGTELTLTHERLPTQEAYDGHAFGWNSSLDSLEHFYINLIKNA